MKRQINLQNQVVPELDRKPKHEIEPGDITLEICPKCLGRGYDPYPDIECMPNTADVSETPCPKCKGKGIIKEVIE